MTTIPQQQTIVQYITNSSQTQYTFAFYAVAAPNVTVYYQASNATPVPSADLLTQGVDYTVTFNADPTTGGFITLLFTPTTGFYLTITLQLQATLTVNFSNAQNFNGANLDAVLQYLLMLIQQVTNYAYNRNLSYVINTYLPNAQPFTQLPPLAQNQFWVGSASGVVAATISQVPSASVLQSMLANASPGTDGARIVGYYDVINNVSTTVDAFLQSLPDFIANITNNYGADTGTLNNLVASNALGATKLYAGLIVAVTAANTNTSNVTLNWNSLGVKSVLFNGNNVPAGYIGVGLTYLFIYNGTNWALINPTIAFASNAQALAGTDTTHPVTSAGLASNKNLTTPGYMQLPGGMIMQWGQSNTVSPNSNTTITFPIPFPNGCLAAQATVINTTGGMVASAAVSTLTATTLEVYNTTQGGSGNPIQWFAIGV